MKKLLSFLFFCGVALSAVAYSFEVDGIFYNITSSSTCGVSNNGYHNSYSGNVSIPASVTYGGNTYSVTSIRTEAFYGCSSLTGITIPKGVTSIGDWAFQDCSSLTSVMIPEGVTSIGRAAFYGCSLTSVTIPESVTVIGMDAFGNTPWYNSQENGLLYLDDWLLGYKGSEPEGVLIIKDGTKGIAIAAFNYCSKLTSVTIPAGVTIIGSSAFNQCSSLTSVTIPGSVKVLNGFTNCSKLANVTIEKGVVSIEEAAFQYCTSLASITIPDGVKSIGEMAFYGCTSLTSITIPNSITSIYSDSFVETPWYDSWYESQEDGLLYFGNCLMGYKGSNPEGTLIIKDGTKVIAENAFRSSPARYVPNSFTGVTSIVIPNSVSNIGAGAFCNFSLTGVTLPTGLTRIGDDAFQYCTGLTSVTIPTGVTSIGNRAFNGCSGLINVTMESSTPCTLGGNSVFDNTNENIKIYVLYGSGDAYKNATEWSKYADKITEYCTSFAFWDGNDYTISDYMPCDELSYTRTYTAGVWAAWYMPFDLVVDEDLLSKFEFAKLSGVLFEDDEWYIGAVKLKAGETVKALVPYLVKAKSSGEQTITVENTPLHAAADNGFSITSAENVFTFTGNCQAKTSSATDVGWYAMSTNGGFTRITKTGATMKGGRFFMTIADRSDNPYATSGAAASNFIRIREMGEATDVEEMMEMPVDETIYDLSGRRVDEPTESGIYIMNGKKIVIK